MTQYNWATCPEEIEKQVLLLCQHLQAQLGSNLVGIYLHGSLALGCFHPQHSDLDLLAVTERKMSTTTRREVIELLLYYSMAPCPIEISFLVEQALKPFVHPLPFDLHYGEDWREQYRKMLSYGDWVHWQTENKTDNDLAAHSMIVWHRGICLYGKPIRETFPSIPEAAYISSLLDDLHWAQIRARSSPVYLILNACRIYAYLREKLILSKDEGGMWGLRVLPALYHPLIQQALAAYRGDVAGPFADYQLETFNHYISAQIQATQE